jgi:hypothetical protein
MPEHQIITPGLDRGKCGKCGKWICREIELKRLKEDMKRASQKKLYQLQKEYDLEVYLSKNCEG